MQHSDETAEDNDPQETVDVDVPDVDDVTDAAADAAAAEIPDSHSTAESVGAVLDDAESTDVYGADVVERQASEFCCGGCFLIVKLVRRDAATGMCVDCS
jgi:hypothetical protein